jgi:phytoene synthase
MSDAPDTTDELGDLDGLIRRVDPDRWISSRFIADPTKRADVIALYAFDHELARAPRVSSNSLLGEIRLTWWREALDEIFEGRTVRRHPTAEALAGAVRRHALDRASLETLIEARYRELDAAPMDDEEALAWAHGTGGQVAELAAAILEPGVDAAPARAAGAAWALGRRAGDQPALQAAFERALSAARREAGGLSTAAFPAVAHAALAGRSRASDLARRLRVTWAVARGRI